MQTPSNVGHDSAIEEIAYLARSRHRATILEHLAEGRFEPSELEEVTEASRTTLGRILGELEDRGWVERTDSGYVATPTGEAIVSKFNPFSDAMQAILRLGDAVEWIPQAEFPIELRHFRNATVQALGQDDPVKAHEFVTEVLRGATSWRVITNLMAPTSKREVMLQGVRTDRLEAVNVYSMELTDRLLADPDRQAWLRNYVDAGATIARYDGRIPCNMFVIDELTIIGDSNQETGNPYTAIVTDNDAVRTWAVELIDDILNASQPITTDLLEDELLSVEAPGE